MLRPLSIKLSLTRASLQGSAPACFSTDPGVKVARAVEVFNASAHIESVAAIARSLGTPEVNAYARANESLVCITVVWELSWYRYEVDLCNEAVGPRLVSRGYDPAQLGDQGAAEALATDARGQLRLCSDQLRRGKALS